MKQLAPPGTLRVGVAYAPSPTPIFVAKDAAGGVHGVPRDLGMALAKALGVPAELVVKATTGELTDAGLPSSLKPGRNDPLHVRPPSYERDIPIQASAAAASSGIARRGEGRPTMRARNSRTVVRTRLATLSPRPASPGMSTAR